ncbi:MAG: alkaline phosphatase family protein [Bacillota bacterium]
MDWQRLRRILAAVLLPLLLVGVALGAKAQTGKSWDAVVGYQTPYAAPLAAGSRTDPAVRRVVVVVIDALRLDTSLQLTTLNSLRNRGASLSVRTGQPSLSHPALATITTGTHQELHGVTTNWYKGLIRLDHIFAVAQREGLNTGAAGYEAYADMHGQSISAARLVPGDDERYDDLIEARGLELLAPGGPDLVFIHFLDVDHAGHDVGPRNPGYFQAAKASADRVARLIAATDLTHTTFIVTADHGHIMTGGHGGWEEEVLTTPLILVGAGVRPGQYPQESQTDLAPTIAALLGLPVPAHATGKPLVDLLELNLAQRADVMVGAATARLGLAKAYASALGAREPSAQLVDEARQAMAGGLHAQALETATQALDGLDRAMASARAGDINRGRLLRLLPVLALASLGLLVPWLFRRDLPVKEAVFAAALYLLLFYGLFVLRGFGFSLSTFNEEGNIQRFFNTRLLETVCFTLVAVGAYAVLAARRGAKGLAHAAGAGMFLYCVTYALFAQVLFFVALWGLNWTHWIPDLRLGIKYYFDLLQMVGVGLVAPVAALVACGLGKAATRAMAKRDRTAGA